MSPTVAPPVIVLGGGGLTLTAVLRLLHRAEISAYAVCAAGTFSRYSRWYNPPAGLGADLGPDDLPELLADLPLERAVLLPCADDWLAATAALPKEFARRFPSSTPPLLAVAAFVDKWRFAQLLQQERLPQPRTQLVTSSAQIDSLPDRDLQCAILKPLSSVQFSGKHGVKGFIVNSREEARRALRKVLFPIMLQEFIPGPPTAGYFVEGFIDRQGHTCALFARQRLRMNPPGLGNSTFMVSVPLEQVADAVAPLQYLLETVSYRGPFSAEFKYDARDGFFKILEVNARPWWYIEAPARAGMDICKMAYRDALELEVETVNGYKAGQYFGYIYDDIRAWRQERKSGGPGFWSWLSSWRKVHSTPFCWNDPVPAFALAWQQLLAYIRHRLRRKPQAMSWAKESPLPEARRAASRG